MSEQADFWNLRMVDPDPGILRGNTYDRATIKAVARYFNHMCAMLGMHKHFTENELVEMACENFDQRGYHEAA